MCITVMCILRFTSLQSNITGVFKMRMVRVSTIRWETTQKCQCFFGICNICMITEKQHYIFRLFLEIWAERVGYEQRLYINTYVYVYKYFDIMFVLYICGYDIHMSNNVALTRYTSEPQGHKTPSSILIYKPKNPQTSSHDAFTAQMCVSLCQPR